MNAADTTEENATHGLVSIEIADLQEDYPLPAHEVLASIVKKYHVPKRHQFDLLAQIQLIQSLHVPFVRRMCLRIRQLAISAVGEKSNDKLTFFFKKKINIKSYFGYSPKYTKELKHTPKFVVYVFHFVLKICRYVCILTIPLLLFPQYTYTNIHSSRNIALSNPDISIKFLEADPNLIKEMAALVAAESVVPVANRAGALRVLQSFLQSQIKYDRNFR